MGTLFIVATPIGNLQDITLRAIDVLGKVDVIACEDTRRAGLLWKRLPFSNATDNTNLSAKKPQFLSYYEQNELQRIPQILRLLKSGEDVALVSDAGTPLVSDPGFKLVRECIKENIRIESIPGPSSVVSALVLSGLPTDKFLFFGYLPKKEGKRKRMLKDINSMVQTVKSTVILFESPYRLVAALKDIKDVFGDIDIALARELTKMYEEIRREKITESIKHFRESKPKGEFVVLLNPAFTTT